MRHYMTTLSGYLAHVPNPLARAYATAYLAWLRTAKRGNPPEWSPNLRWQAAAAVRMNVTHLLVRAGEIPRLKRVRLPAREHFIPEMPEK